MVKVVTGEYWELDFMLAILNYPFAHLENGMHIVCFDLFNLMKTPVVRCLTVHCQHFLNALYKPYHNRSSCGECLPPVRHF